MDFRSVLGITNKRRLALLEKLYYRREGWSSDQLMSELNCSLPILLNDIDLINAEHPSFQILKTKGLYHIVVDKKVSMGNLYANFLNTCPEFQIIEELLYEECESIIGLAKKLYLSSSNTQRYLKKIEKDLIEAGMELCYRPLRIEGNEGEIRNFYYRFYSERQSAFESTLPQLPPDHYHIMEQYVSDFVEENQIHEKYIFQKRMLYTMYVSFWRIKRGHPFPKEALRTEGLKLPQGASYQALKQAVREKLDMELTPNMLRDTLWLTFSDSIVFSVPHLKLALTDNLRYQQLFAQHYELVEEYNKMLGYHLSRNSKFGLTIVLSNDFYMHDPQGRYICILRRNREAFLKEVSEVYPRGVEKIRQLVKRFVHNYHMYQEEDFILSYMYLLITTEVDSLELLANQEPLLNILLLSDLAPTEETFLAKQISDNIYGNFRIVHFEKLSGGTPALYSELKKYDCLITTGSSRGLPKDYPVVVIDPFLTSQSRRWIQEMVSNLGEKKSQIQHK
ncbi:helix-turn-helix domain-containing protein [Enterococcus sp. AZ196]|uniref:helix-turn-helix domain-containing protein n=1 Tax=Enterococcus sp. AZ196 TaxID=2774659 RepID=UPI003D2D3B93